MVREARRHLQSFRKLNSRLVSTTLPVSILILLLGVGALELSAFRQSTQDQKTHLEQVARMGSQLLAPAIWRFEADTIRSSLDRMAMSSDVVAVVVVTPEDDVPIAWLLTTGPEPLYGNEEALPADIDLSGYPVIREEITIDKLGNQRLGELSLYYDTAALRSEAQRRFVLMLLAGLLAAGALTTLLLGVIRQSVLQPVLALTESMRSGQAGHEYHLVEHEGRDEISSLVREYNDMLAAEAALKAEGRHRLELYEHALDNISQGFCVFDRDFRLMAFNNRYALMLGHEQDAIELGMTLSELLKVNAEHGEYGSGSIDGLIIDRLAIAAGGERYRRERERPDGTFVEIDSNPLPGGGFVSIYHDITNRKEYEKKLRHMTLADPLTQLPNRALFYDRLRQSLSTAERLGHRLALLMIDIDGFSIVNETQSRDVGDLVLREVGQRLESLCRKSDTVARFEKDIFCIVQQHLDNVDDAAFLAHRILGSFARPFETEEVALRMTASIGMTIYPDDDLSSRNVLMHASLALHAAKAEGRNRYRYFVPEMDRAVAARRRLEEDLFMALRDDQFVLHYQPKVELSSGQVVGAEALVRWQHPEQGLLAPTEFIQLAEERGLIVPLTEWILEEACRQIRVWHEAGLNLGPVSINLSPFHFQEGDVVRSITAAIEKTSVERRLLAVEVTEKALLQNSDTVANSLLSLRELGIGAGIDDFGTGYSSISSLHQFPIDTIKIDRRFVHGFGADDEASTVVRAVIFLGRKLNLRIVAEGVEEENQLRLLEKEGCTEVQGNYFSPPLPADDFALWLSERDSKPVEPAKTPEPA